MVEILIVHIQINAWLCIDILAIMGLINEENANIVL
jgi:hypothetical protein